MQSVPLLWAWITVLATNPFGQAMMLYLVTRLALALVVGYAVGWTIARLLRRPMTRLTAAAVALSPVPIDPEARAEAGDEEAEPASVLRALPLLLRLLR